MYSVCGYFIGLNIQNDFVINRQFPGKGGGEVLKIMGF